MANGKTVVVVEGWGEGPVGTRGTVDPVVVGARRTGVVGGTIEGADVGGTAITVGVDGERRAAETVAVVDAGVGPGRAVVGTGVADDGYRLTSFSGLVPAGAPPAASAPTQSAASPTSAAHPRQANRARARSRDRSTASSSTNPRST
ncbi:MAG TPA: hypothetical protein VGP92_03965 [Acidimicrobiia bacterium]|nr:hypothetical protein [Acidimicrobiia bacterium]